MNGWVRGGDYEDTLDVQAENGTAGPGAGRIAKITINRSEVRNAFRPTTLFDGSRNAVGVGRLDAPDPERRPTDGSRFPRRP